MNEENTKQKRGVPPEIWVFLSSVFFAMGGLLFKIISWDALAISSARSILAGGAILIFLLVRKHRFVLNRDVVLAALSISATNTLYAMANKMTTAGNTIVLQFTMPVFVILIMALFFGKKPGKSECIVCLLVMAGHVDFWNYGNASLLCVGDDFTDFVVSVEFAFVAAFALILRIIELWISLAFDAPRRMVGQMPMKIVQLVETHQVKRFFEHLNGLIIAPRVVHESTERIT